MRQLIFISALSFLVQCSNGAPACTGKGTGQGLTPYCTTQSPDERSMLAFNQGDTTLAATLLETLIQNEPKVYFRYPRLAAVYAVQAGFSLLNTDITNLNGTGFALLTQVFPAPKGKSRSAFQKQIAKMKAAKDLLLLMPLAQRTSGKTPYGASAQFQLTIYLTAFAAMTINQFFSADGQVDLALLETLSAADAVNILESLLLAAQVSAQISPQLSPKVQGVVDEINQAGGDNEQQKIQAYIQSQAS